MPRWTPVLVLASAAALGIGAAAASPNDDPAVTTTRAATHTTVTTTCPIPARYRAAFAAAADDARLPLALLAAVAHEESRFSTAAQSPRGAVGLLQVMPETGRALGLDVTRPAANVLAGA